MYNGSVPWNQTDEKRASCALGLTTVQSKHGKVSIVVGLLDTDRHDRHVDQK